MFGSDRTRELMQKLEDENFYELNAEELKQLQNSFDADFCNGDEGKAYIKDVFLNDNYLMDPHTATCLKSYDTCCSDTIKTIAYSTAEWTKFSPVIANALTGEEDAEDIVALESISKITRLNIPPMIKGLFTKKVVQSSVINKEDIQKEILDFI